MLVVTAAIGNRDESGETVSAGDVRAERLRRRRRLAGRDGGDRRGHPDAPCVGRARSEEPQSETPQGGPGSSATGSSAASGATKTLVEGIDNAGVPDTPQGERGGRPACPTGRTPRVDDLEDAQESLDKEADSLEDALEQLTGGGEAIAVDARRTA